MARHIGVCSVRDLRFVSFPQQGKYMQGLYYFPLTRMLEKLFTVLSFSSFELRDEKRSPLERKKDYGYIP